MKVSVFGNPDLKEDSLVVRLVPKLKKKLPGVEFKVEDPVEGLRPPEDGLWVILDVAKGIEGVRVVNDLDKLIDERRVSLHDYDLGMELKLLKKLGKIKELRLIMVAMGMKEDKALRLVGQKLKQLIPRERCQRYG
jgi:hypothetical protein